MVVGLGEVGAALRTVLDCDGHDPAKDIFAGDGPYAFLHICFPHQDTPHKKSFNDFTRGYIARFKPTYTVVHSTVPVGTCAALGICHSPIRGKHPRLAESIKTFKKFVGGPGAQAVAEEFQKYGIEAVAWPSSSDCEAQKLWDLAQFYWSIMIMREIHEYCDAHGLDFDHVYTAGNQAYNDGYAAMDHSEFIRPILKFQPGPIGGHCVKQNVPLLEGRIVEILKQHEEQFSKQEMVR